jgi:hypothetical protein
MVLLLIRCVIRTAGLCLVSVSNDFSANKDSLISLDLVINCPNLNVLSVIV